MKVAAYQAPLDVPDVDAALELVLMHVERCEQEGVELLCCPECVLGGLGDSADDPFTSAIDVESGELELVLKPLRSRNVAVIVGFTEIQKGTGRLYNSAAVIERGSIIGVHRKMKPAINRSVYHAGDDLRTFRVGGLTFGVLICRDSTFPDLARDLAHLGAFVLFVPSNNGLPEAKTGPDLVDETLRQDCALAKANRMWVVRSDVAGRTSQLVAYGTTTIIRPSGEVLCRARPLRPGLLIADVGSAPLGPTDAGR